MLNNKSKIEFLATSENFLEEKLNRLENFLSNNDCLENQEIINWTSECYVLFNTLGVEGQIIKDFMKSVDLNVIALTNGDLGAFMITDQSIMLHPSDSRRYPISLVFKIAKSKLEALKAEKNLVPQWLLESLSQREELSKIYTSLNSIEDGYKKKSSKFLIMSANTLLDILLDYNPDLKKKGKLGLKLQSLIENDEHRKFFGLSRDMAIALNNSKTIRNEEVVHPSVDLGNNLPLLVSISYAYLVTLSLIFSLTTGNLEINNSNTNK